MTITGTVSNQAVNDNANIDPFADVKITEPNVDQTETVTVTPSQTANGTLSDPNAATDGSTITNGVYKVTGTATQVTTDLDALVFHPTVHQVAPGNTVTTGFTIALTDSPRGLDRHRQHNKRYRDGPRGAGNDHRHRRQPTRALSNRAI